jgi:hypothetical protein
MIVAWVRQSRMPSSRANGFVTVTNKGRTVSRELRDLRLFAAHLANAVSLNGPEPLPLDGAAGLCQENRMAGARGRG